MAAKKPLTFQQALMASFNPVGNGTVGQRASHEAMLRYLPQIQALLLLRQQTGLQGRQNIQSVRRGGLAAAGGIGGVRSSFTQQLADTPAPTSQAAAHLGLTRDAVAGDLAKMQAQQYSGISAGVAQARRSTQTDQANIVQQLLSAAQQGSLYNTSEYDSLANDAHKAAQARQQAKATLNAGLLKAGYDPSGHPLPTFDRLHPVKTPTVNKYGRTAAEWHALSDQQRKQIIGSYSSSGAGGSGGGVSAAQSTKFRTQYDTAIHYANTFRHDLTPSEIVDVLTNGRPSQPVYATQKVKNANGTVTNKRVRTGTIAAIKPITDPLALHAAVQMVTMGGVTAGTLKKLRRNGYLPRKYGIKPYRAPANQGALGVPVGPDGRKT